MQSDSQRRCRPDRPARFLARVDAHLSKVAHGAARRAFINAQIEAWERRYARFIATEGKSEPVRDPVDPPMAADFLLTITGLVARRDALPRIAESERIMNEANEPLGRAMLALLVAADQRCPSIIGQAHLLYHARGARAGARESVRQLERDVTELLKAIAEVQATL